MEQDSCPECGNTRLVTDYVRAELVCELCGTVVAQNVLKVVGVGTKSEDGSLAFRSGDSRLLPQHPDSFSSRDSEGRPVDRDALRKFRTTARMQNLRASERAILGFESRMRDLARSRGINEDVTKRAADMYKQVRDGKVFSKPNITELALALLLAANREMGYVITLEDLVAGTAPPASENKVLRYLNHTRDGSPGIVQALGIKFPLPSVNSFILYFASKIGKERDQLLLGVARGKALNAEVNATPHCVAAAALYSALVETGEEESQHEYCSRVRISEITLREGQRALNGGTRPGKRGDQVQRLDPSVLREE